MSESEWTDLLNARKQFLDYFRSIKENCQIMELSFDGYQVLEERLNNLDLSLIHSYYTFPSSFFSDNTLETKSKSKESERIIIRPKQTFERLSDKESYSVWLNAIEAMNQKPKRVIIRG